MEIDHLKPTITLFADASLSVADKRAGFGGWAVADGKGSIKRFGRLPYSVHTDVVELWAIQSMLGQIQKIWGQDNHQCIIVQSDNLNSLRLMTGYSGKIKPARTVNRADSTIALTPLVIPDRAAPVFEKMGPLLDRYDLVYVRHVKGHKGGQGSRHSVNEMCDRLAKRSLSVHHFDVLSA